MMRLSSVSHHRGKHVLHSNRLVVEQDLLFIASLKRSETSLSRKGLQKTEQRRQCALFPVVRECTPKRMFQLFLSTVSIGDVFPRIYRCGKMNESNALLRRISPKINPNNFYLVNWMMLSLIITNPRARLGELYSSNMKPFTPRSFLKFFRFASQEV